MKNYTEVKVIRIPNCDFCESEAKYDGKTRLGPWANMCSMHFKQYGLGLGLGLGQKLIQDKPTQSID